ncbi:MAG TPA: tRNA lysidine(34) synthetase TilS [Bryobacteraceae bacterium]|nr:tRNA lysidine(34) synthetase TilS [Bryobacteraceae bacterium]
MLDRVRRTVSRYRMLAPGDRVIAAVSGGPDSVCLLHVLREIEAKLAGVAHFNHKLRGEESDGDEHFVASLAARMGLPFYRAEAGLEQARGNLEQRARRDRREFLLGLMRDGAGDRVALGHTRDDQAETVLFRMMRGSGLRGLAGVLPVTADGFVRPLIGVTRTEILSFLRARGIAWREDSSNFDRRFARNRIRHELMPMLAREWNPKIADALANLADLAFEEEIFWDLELSKIAQEGGSGEPESLPRALARRIVRKRIEEVRGSLRGIEFEHVERVIEMKRGRIRLPGVDVIRSLGRMAVVPAGSQPEIPEVEVTVPGTYAAPDGNSEIRLEPCVNLGVELAAPLYLRGWRPGDHYRRVGKSHDQKIKEMFQRARVPLWQRRGWPILEYDGSVVWARQFGHAENAPVRVSETLRQHRIDDSREM